MIGMKAADMIAPAIVRRQFLRGLNLYANGLAGEGLRAETVAWARRLSRGEPITLEKARTMRAWFARHGASRLEVAARHRQQAQLEQGVPPRRAPALTAWLLWGGDEGRAWAQDIVASARDGHLLRFHPSR